MLLIFLMYALFASLFVIGKEAILHIPPILFIGIRMTLSGLLLIGWVWWQQGQIIGSYKKFKKNGVWFVGIIFFHIYSAYTTEFWALQYLTAAKTCLFYNLSPFITALFAYLCFHEVMTIKKWIGLCIGFIALLPTMMTDARGTEFFASHIGWFSLPELAMLISVSCSVIGWTCMRKLTRDQGYSYIAINGIGMFFGGILSLITSHGMEKWPNLISLVRSIPVMRSLFLIIFIGNIVCYNLYGKLLHRYSTTVLSFFGFLTPLFAALMGWLYLGESVAPSFFISLALVTVGLSLFYQEELKLGYIL